MTDSGRYYDPPRPWHLILSPLLPTIALLSNNLSSATIGAVMWPMAIGLSGVLATWAFVVRLVGYPRTSALVITIITVAVLSHATLAMAASLIGLHHAPAVLYTVVLALCVLVVRRRRAVIEITTFVNLVMLITMLIFVARIGWDELQRSRLPAITPPAALAVHALPVAAAPDVYVLMLDGYGRADVLREQYGFENGLVADLERLGFFVAANAASNYAQTAQSLASSLNVEQLPTLVSTRAPADHDRRRLGELIAENRVFAALRSSGYHIRFYESEYALLRPRQAEERPAPWMHVTDFAYSLYETTAFPYAFKALGLQRSWFPLEVHRRQVRWTLNHLAQESLAGRAAPTFVFAHILMPHPPFAFKADGSDRSTDLPAALWDGDHWRTMADGSGESYMAGYVDSVRFLNARVVDIVRHVMSTSTRPTIFYIQGDHGPGFRLRWDNPEVTDMRERFGIILAARFPNGNHSRLHPAITPVNAWRVILNQAIGTQLPMLEDRSYFATWDRPFDLIDVTDRIKNRF